METSYCKSELWADYKQRKKIHPFLCEIDRTLLFHDYSLVIKKQNSIYQDDNKRTLLHQWTVKSTNTLSCTSKQAMNKLLDSIIVKTLWKPSQIWASNSTTLSRKVDLIRVHLDFRCRKILSATFLCRCLCDRLPILRASILFFFLP